MAHHLVRGDGVAWLAARPEKSVHAIVTDPPFAVREFRDEAPGRRGQGGGEGAWRHPPTLGGRRRSPLPRFTDLSRADLRALDEFYAAFAAAAARALVPGGHLFVATNRLVSHLVYAPLAAAGLERRGEVVRLVRTLRAGDRPRKAEEEFAGVCSMPRALYEPWGLFRKPIEGTLAANLRRWAAGALRRPRVDRPFEDVIPSERTPDRERAIARHPNIKPQAFLRRVVHASLPLGRGLVADPFMGSGSTVAAAGALGYEAVGVELREDTYRMAVDAVPRLAALRVDLDLDP